MEQQIDRAITCAFTGHRPSYLPWGEREDDPRCLVLKQRLDEAVARAYGMGYRHFICGMAKGADFYFCEAVLKLRKDHSDVILEAAVPCPSQSDRWSAADQARYRTLLDRCDLETLIQQIYTATCMHRRNRYMVDHASRLIAVFNGRPDGSGTLKTLNYGLKQGLEIDMIEV